MTWYRKYNQCTYEFNFDNEIYLYNGIPVYLDEFFAHQCSILLGKEMFYRHFFKNKNELFKFRQKIRKYRLSYGDLFFKEIEEEFLHDRKNDNRKSGVWKNNVVST